MCSPPETPQTYEQESILHEIRLQVLQMLNLSIEAEKINMFMWLQNEKS